MSSTCLAWVFILAPGLFFAVIRFWYRSSRERALRRLERALSAPGRSLEGSGLRRDRLFSSLLSTDTGGPRLHTPRRR